MNSLILILTILILLCLPYSAFSQGIWKTYTRADGLAGDTVVTIIQDKFGIMWFGTWGGGLSKLEINGAWTNFLNDSITYIKDIELDSRNNKWLALSRSGKTWVVKFDDSTFTYYSPEGYPKDDPKPICLGQDSSGQIWCGTTMGAAYWFDCVIWHPIQIIPFCDWSFIREIKRSPLDDLFFAHDQGITVFKAGHFAKLWGGSDGWYICWVNDLVFDKKKQLWFTMVSDIRGGLGLFDGTSWHIWSKSDGLLKDDLWAVAIDSSNNVWFSYYDFLGVAKFDGLTFTHFSKVDGLANNLVWDIFVDQDRNIWFATHGGGVSVLQDTTSSVDWNKQFTSNEELFNLFQNYPNPFNTNTIIRYEINKEAKVLLTIHNLAGKEVITLVNKQLSAGEYYIKWDGKNNLGKEVSSGIYIALLKYGGFKKSIKLSLIR